MLGHLREKHSFILIQATGVFYKIRLLYAYIVVSKEGEYPTKVKKWPHGGSSQSVA